MSFLGVIFKAADLVLAGAQAVDRGIDLGKKIARKLKSPTKPPEPSQPWTYKDVRHVDDMSDAGATNHRVSTDTQRLPRLTQMRPPPLKPRPRQ